MSKWIELPIVLADNDPDDDTDYESLGVAPPKAPLVVEQVLLFAENIERVNRSSRGDYPTAIWIIGNETPYHCPLEYEEIKKIILNETK